MLKDSEEPAETAEQAGVLPVASRVLFLVVLALCALRATPAAAAVNLFWIQNLTMGMGGSYHFFDSSSGAGGGQRISSSKHEFFESYQLSGDFSLLNPRFIQGSAGVDLGLSQLRGTDQAGRKQSSHELNLGYDVSGILFREKYLSVQLGAGSHLATESPPFSRSFEVKSDDLRVTAGIRNQILPVKFSLVHNSSQTSGLEADRRQKTDTATVSVEHADGSFSITNLSLLSTRSESALLAGGLDASQREMTVALANSLRWENERNLTRSLVSSYSYDANGGFQNGSSQNVSSSYRTQLGKALDAAADYHLVESRTDSQTLQAQSGSVSLTHRLYESLFTSLGATGSSSRFTDGTQDSFGGGAGVNYTYLLPSETRYSLSYNYSYAVSDRRRNSSLGLVQNERHAIPSADPKRIALGNPSFLADTVTVRGAQTLTLYTSVQDFVVTAEGIEVLPGHMVGDTDLLVSYSFLLDPRVSYASTGQNLSGRLNLAGKQHAFYFDARSSKSSLLSGSATEVTLTPSYHLDLGYDFSGDRQTMHGEYGWTKGYSSDLQYLDTRWRYQTTLGLGAVTLSANDYFNWNMQSGIREGRWDNSLNLQSAYTRKVSESIFAALGVNYLNSLKDSSRAGVANFFSANVKLDGNFGKTTVSVSSNLSWNVSSSATSRSESVGISFHRFF